MITSFVDMEAKPDPQQPKPNNQETVRVILLFLKTVFMDEKKIEMKTAFKDSPKTNPLLLLYFMYITLLNMTIPSSDKIRRTITQISIEEWKKILLTFLNHTPREQGLPWTEEEKEVWVLILYFISYQERTREQMYLLIQDTDHRDIQYSQLSSLGLKAFKETRPIKIVISFLKSVFKKREKHKVNKNLEDLLNFIYIALLDKNLVRSKRDNTFKNLKSLLLYGQTKIEQWETILLTFLNHTPRKQGLPWTDEEKEVWILVLFFVSEQFGCPSSTGKGHLFLLENQKRRAQLSPLIIKLGLKPFKETTTSMPENPCAKKYQIVVCRICEFHGDPRNPSKMCRCCYECNSRDSDCKRCRICREHDSTKCTCCPICNTSAEGCRKCPECNENDECSC